MTNTAIEKVLVEVMKMRIAYTGEATTDNTAIAIIDDIIALLEKELVD